MKKNIYLKNATMTTIPLPVSLVTSIGSDNQADIAVVTYVTGVNEEPAMFGISLRPEKYSNSLIKQSEEFVINIPEARLIKEVDYCGTHSGRNVQKFKVLKLTPVKAEKVKAPLILECPINIECRLKKIIKLPSHDFFIGEAVAVHADQEKISQKKNQYGVFLPRFDRLSFLFTTFLDYRVIGKKIGTAFAEHKKLSFVKQTSRKEEVCQ